MVAESGLSNNGGYNFDLVLAEHFANIFDSKPDRAGKSSIKNNRRAMVKLLKECNRLKHVLSSNKEAQFYVEGILDGIDFVSSIKKE